MKNILIIGALYSGNLGDDVIFDVVYHVCRSVPCHIQKMSISGRNEPAPIGSASSSGLKQSLKNRIRRLKPYQRLVEKKRCKRLRTVLEQFDFSGLDLIIFDGGQLFFDVFVPLIAIIMEKAGQYPVKILFNACGVGLLNQKNKMILRRIAENPQVSLMTLREDASDFLRQIQPDPILCKNKLFRVMDPAIHCCDIFPPAGKTNIIGIGLINETILKKHGIVLHHHAYMQLVRQIVNFCELHSLSYEFFCNGDNADYAFLKEVQKSIGKQIPIAPRPTSSEELAKLISHYDRIISFRLHSHIIAASYRVPSFGLVWDTKVREFFEAVDRQNALFTVSDQMDLTVLDKQLEQFMTSPYTIHMTEYQDACDVLKETIIGTSCDKTKEVKECSVG